ncbi:MAG: DUF3313 domain-containing protein [Steroidobacteraceae bacterium]
MAIETRRTFLGAAVVAAALTLAGPAARAADPPNSGFLPDYSRLEPVKTKLGKEADRWLSPQLTRENYHAIIIEPVVFYPTPEPTEQVPQKTLDDITSYLTNTLRDVVFKDVPQVGAPGPGVAKLQVAVTAVAVGSTGMKPYEFIPAALVFSTAMRAAGQRSQDVAISVEALMTDSVSGDPLAMVVRHGSGDQLKNAKTALTLEQLRSRIDQWAKTASEMVGQRLSRPPGAN